jgi:Aspartyl protease
LNLKLKLAEGLVASAGNPAMLAGAVLRFGLKTYWTRVKKLTIPRFVEYNADLLVEVALQQFGFTSVRPQRIERVYITMNLPLGLPVVSILTLCLTASEDIRAASSHQASREESETQIFATPDESSLPVESVKDGESLLPLAEMMGSGGLKWFMVKSRNGNVGWIKAGDNNAAKRVEGHFRSLPNEISVIRSSSKPQSASKSSANGAIAIPVSVRGSKVIVSVTFNDSITANLLLDTGASRTMISTRTARDLRLQSTGSGVGYGIGGYVRVSTARIDSVRIGEAEMRNISVMIHDFSPDPSYEGLLGFDLLSQFHMSLDLQKAVLVLTPRKA